LKQGQALIAAGDANGAILALRPAVNLAPRSASLRAALARAYLAAGRGLDAVAEVRRALALVPASDQAGQTELTGLLAQGLTQSGDTTAARAAYEQILAAQPRAHWARLGLAGLLLAQNQAEDAEAHYRAVRRADPANKEAAERLARLLAARGDYAGAREEMAVMSPRLRFALARALFDGGASTVAATLARQRKAYEEGQISREVFHKAASLQAERVSALTVLLRDAPPSAGESLIRAYRRRILAASLLAQAAASVLSYLETGEATAGSQAAVLLGEARREIAEAQTLEKSPSAANRAAEGGAARAAP
jgi:thioredoxin-like negative regulator of GroEL